MEIIGHVNPITVLLSLFWVAAICSTALLCMGAYKLGQYRKERAARKAGK